MTDTKIITAQLAADKSNLNLVKIMISIQKALESLVVTRQIEVSEITPQTINRLIELGYYIHPKQSNGNLIINW